MSAAAVKKKRTTKGRRSGTMLLSMSWRVFRTRWREALAEVPPHILTDIEKALLLREQGDEEKADELLDRALAQLPRDAVGAFKQSRAVKASESSAAARRDSAAEWKKQLRPQIENLIKAGLNNEKIGHRLGRKEDQEKEEGPSWHSVRRYASELRRAMPRPPKK